MNEGEFEKLLTENLRVARENNELLKKMHRGAVWGRVFRAFYWVIILGSAFGLYFFLQPYVDTLRGSYGAFSEFLNDPRGALNETFGN